MDTRKVPVFCYWNGCIKDGPFYQGPSPRVLRVESKIELPKLLDDLHRVTGFKKGKFQIHLIGRYPSIVQQPIVKYVRLPIVDDCSLETMLEVLSYHPCINNVELYLEVANVVADDASVRDDTLSTLREDNNKNWIIEEESTDAGNWINNGGDNGRIDWYISWKNVGCCGI